MSSVRHIPYEGDNSQQERCSWVDRQNYNSSVMMITSVDSAVSAHACQCVSGRNSKLDRGLLWTHQPHGPHFPHEPCTVQAGDGMKNALPGTGPPVTRRVHAGTSAGACWHWTSRAGCTSCTSTASCTRTSNRRKRAAGRRARGGQDRGRGSRALYHAHARRHRQRADGHLRLRRAGAAARPALRHQGAASA